MGTEAPLDLLLPSLLSGHLQPFASSVSWVVFGQPSPFHGLWCCPSHAHTGISVWGPGRALVALGGAHPDPALFGLPNPHQLGQGTKHKFQEVEAVFLARVTTGRVALGGLGAVSWLLTRDLMAQQRLSRRRKALEEVGAGTGCAMTNANTQARLSSWGTARSSPVAFQPWNALEMFWKCHYLQEWFPAVEPQALFWILCSLF